MVRPERTCVTRHCKCENYFFRRLEDFVAVFRLPPVFTAELAILLLTFANGMQTSTPLRQMGTKPGKQSAVYGAQGPEH